MHARKSVFGEGALFQVRKRRLRNLPGPPPLQSARHLVLCLANHLAVSFVRG